MTETDVPDLPELRALIAADPLPSGSPDLGPLRAAGRRRLRSRRAGIVGLSAAAVAAVAVPASLIAGGGPTAQDPIPAAPAASESAPVVPPSPPGQECGLLMCSAPGAPAAGREDTAEVTGSLVTGVLSDGGEEIVYATREPGADDTMTDVLKIGHRRHGAIESGVWALQPATDGPIRFWSELGGRVNEKAGHSGDFVVLGYVDGAPDEITWSTPDGATGAVDGMSSDLIEGRTVFYLSLPRPAGEAGDTGHSDLPSALGALLAKDGEHYVVLPDGSVYRMDGAKGYVIDGSQGFDTTGMEQVDPAAVGITPEQIESARAQAAPTVTPELTIHTSDGRSCSLAECGTSG